MAFDKKASRLRRSRQTRHKISELRVNRLSVFRSNAHIYANILSPEGDRVLVSASTVEADVRGRTEVLRTENEWQRFRHVARSAGPMSVMTV